MKLDHVTARAGSDLVKGAAKHSLFTLYEGWAMRYRMLPDGQRQILDFALPGDTIGLGSALLGSSEHVLALTNVSLCELDVGRISPLFEQQPQLALSMLMGRLQEQERADARATLLGRLNAAQRVGHLLMELYLRLEERGLADGSRFASPLRAIHIADAVGLSRVHVMRALRELRLRKLVDIQERRVHIRNARRLAAFSAFKTSAKKLSCSLL